MHSFNRYNIFLYVHIPKYNSSTFFLFNCYTLMHVYFTSNRSRIRINHLWNCTHTKKLTIDRVKFVFNWNIFLSCTAQLGQIPVKSNFVLFLNQRHLHIYAIIFRDLQMVSQILFSRIPKCFHQLSPQNWFLFEIKNKMAN